MPRYETDDALYRIQARWIDAGGKRMFVTARYVSWGIFLTSLVPFVLIIQLLTGWVWGVIYGMTAAAILAWAVADFINGEYRVGSWGGILGSEVASLRRARARRTGPRVQRITPPVFSTAPRGDYKSPSDVGQET